MRQSLKIIAYVPTCVPVSTSEEVCAALQAVSRRYAGAEFAILEDDCATAKIPKDGKIDQDSPIVETTKLSSTCHALLLILPSKEHYDFNALLRFVKKTLEENEYCEIWWGEIGALRNEQKDWELLNTIQAFNPMHVIGELGPGEPDLSLDDRIYTQVLFQVIDFWMNKFDRIGAVAQSVPD